MLHEMYRARRKRLISHLKMLRVYVIRHAPACERDRKRWPDDRRRPLTPEGVRKFRKAAAGLARMAPSVDRVLTSPLARARETAEILAREAGWPPAVESAALAPGAGAARALAALRDQRVETLAAVGHEPGLSELLALGIAAAGGEVRFALKKGGAACICFPSEVGPGRGHLEWLLAPRTLRALA